MESPSASSHVEHGRVSTRGSCLQASPARCIHCNPQHKENARNLINTNVVKLFTKIDLKSTHPEQHAYYSSGIGTRRKSRLQRLCYISFCFSRGAYQVRVLAGMIYEAGLTRTPTTEQIGTAYNCYEVICSGKSQTRQIAREFKEKFSWKDLRVHIVGVWDTVSSVGLVRGDVFLSMFSSAPHACHFRHALALDEIRVKFMPEYFHEINSLIDDEKSKFIVTSPDVEYASSSTSERRESNPSVSGTDLSEGEGNTPDIKEVWFAGSHSDVLHQLQPRRIIPGQKIHASVLYANTYKPKATLGEGFDLPAVQPGLEATELDHQVWEVGLFDGTAAQELLTYLGSQQRISVKCLDRLLCYDSGREKNAPGTYLTGKTSS
ncbi:hypothetical protein JVT61DRAFT_3274 [Boletus reticuloceps]|uniref:T6SS Phospholipase effector Tle1-like catalytic domain-containing protein n=1 Tax=Boletus reticuloceps TaxID=495285 RepID=A0A8I2YMP9_9AGAM|nr:hypothetical protein JVT61DRAFT_3274 [Boletus reticuloceps]